MRQPSSKPANNRRPAARIKTVQITDAQVVFLADPSCKRCYGLGYVGTVETKGERQWILCGCVHRALAAKGQVPWVQRKERQLAKQQPTTEVTNERAEN